MTVLELCLKLSQLCVHVCGIGDRIPHADASFHACERDTWRVTSVSVAIGDDCLTERMQRKSVQTGKAPCSATDGRAPKRKTLILRERHVLTWSYTWKSSLGFFVYAPLCVCFQSSDSEVRRLSEQLSQRDGALQPLEQERDRLVQLDQVRPQEHALTINARLQNTPLTHKYVNSLKGTLAIKGYLWQQEE